MNKEEIYMLEALKEAKKAFNEGEVPVGAIIVYNDRIIAKAHNKKEKYNCATEHAEMIAIRKASKYFNNWRLNDCTMYVTVQPCTMCISAIKHSRITNIVYGMSFSNEVEMNLFDRIVNKIDNNKPVNVIGNILSNEAALLIKKFFDKKRK